MKFQLALPFLKKRRVGGVSVKKICKHILFYSQLALPFLKKEKGRRRFGKKNMQAYFVLLSTCTTFAENI
jgi:hypothetical protein